jgi:hypothetical protein
MIRRRTALAAAILGSSLLATGTISTLAASAPAHPRHGVAYGQVSGLSPNGFTLTRTLKHPRANGSTTVVVTVSTTAATKEMARKGTTGVLANGEYALVTGMKSGSDLRAQRILYSATPFTVHRHRVVGTVLASSATALTIQTRTGKSITIAINSATHYRVNKQLQSAAPPLTTGERVAVRFTLDKATKARLARVITILRQP